MTARTLYRSVEIESAEQAEALPEGTIANRVLTFESIWETVTQPEVAIKIGCNAWYSSAVDADAWDWLDRHLVGWTALVPIEAEEQHIRASDGRRAKTVYVTPWRPVDGPTIEEPAALADCGDGA